MTTHRVHLMQGDGVSLHKIQELVRDKDVLLVGNNLSGVEKDQGYLIDCYDIVVRFGKGVTTGRTRQLGAKTDLWVTGEFRKKMRGFFPDAEVLWNPSSYKTIPEPPEYEHTEMFGREEIEKINAEYGSQGSRRLSAGAITAYWFVHAVKTQKSLSLINFDFFHHSILFKDNKQDMTNKASSWHIPIALAPYQNLDPSTHPAHDLMIERKLFETLLKQDNVVFVGKMPEAPKIIECDKAAYDEVREQIELYTEE